MRKFKIIKKLFMRKIYAGCSEIFKVNSYSIVVPVLKLIRCQLLSDLL